MNTKVRNDVYLKDKVASSLFTSKDTIEYFYFYVNKF